MVTKAPLVPEIYYGRDAEALAKYGQIPALDNLYIFATSNLDEASLPLNQKLLDKVYTVYLQETPAAVPAEEKDNRWFQPRFREIGEDLPLAQEYFPLFEQLNQILTEATSYMGYQMRNDAVLYLMNNDAMPRQEAEDHMICQKVLTRLQGGRKLLPVLEKLQNFCKDYPCAARALERMYRLCETEDYCSYWS